MDKKQFFESFVVESPDQSGHILSLSPKIRQILGSVAVNIADHPIKKEYETLSQELLFRIWMFESICNGGSTTPPTDHWEEHIPLLPLITIYVSWELVFVNQAYCQASGLSPTEAQTYARSGELYDMIYAGSDANLAMESVNRLKIGKGYQNLELRMKHSNRRTLWNSYGGIGSELEIRSGREIMHENRPEELEGFYRGSNLDSHQLFDEIRSIIQYVPLTADQLKELDWIEEILSMFDFLWNHGGLLMEVTNISEDGQVLSGNYNSRYAQFRKQSYSDIRSFQEVIFSVYSREDSKDFLQGKFDTIDHPSGRVFHTKKSNPSALVRWKHYVYQQNTNFGQTTILWVGVLIHRIKKPWFMQTIIRTLFRIKRKEV